jgi:hypothetical protein
MIDGRRLEDCLEKVVESHPADVVPGLWEDIERCLGNRISTMAEAYDGYRWIKVPKYVMDEAKTWEDRYKELERHHIHETTFLINKVRELAAALEKNRIKVD